ncbi:arsenate reductase (glutaredoxin) [Leeia sp. TBRC 13508]|uniref:Arsenate reductase n=1 Tax=Leeia speluncae TaxID=2884804 RepID=A0ABS8D661_9NEIS|nr:arsenate reductase (glutaredoxin) [Leeia speluncae]MCB6183461.1 arsenate reductase (glutaredoxin) [Leeia speluncae]
MNVTLYHYSACSKSRAVAELLDAAQLSVDVRLYVENPLTQAELSVLMNQLGILHPKEMMRTKDALFAELGLDQEGLSQAEYLDAMTKHPILMERPIVVIGDTAKIGRPPESIQAWISALAS